MRLLLPCVLCCLLTACSSTEQRTYDVSIENRTTHTLTFGLVKNGGPFEHKWAAPEDLLTEHPEANWGHVVEPGHIGHLMMEGQFDPRVSAVLRIYSDKRQVDDLVAVASYDHYKIKEVVPPGKHRIMVQENKDGLTATPVEVPGSSPPP